MLRSAIITYTMGVTENEWSVARLFGLEPETVLWANVRNDEDLPNIRLVGRDLLILPVDGALYTVQPGDTLEKVALRHRVTEEAIYGFALNGLEEPYELQPGQQLIVPGATRSYREGLYYESSALSYQVYPPSAPPLGSGTFAWPTEGVMTQGYWSGHYALDIANDTGTPVVAADHGYVILAGKDTSIYGNQVLIGHGNGYVTRYAHLETMSVKAGDDVIKGQQIGTIGSTGNATTPHLHFEIVEEGLRRDPLDYLP